jgi:hypothetical protein
MEQSGLAKRCREELSGTFWSAIWCREKGASEAFWSAIGNKVNDIPCSLFSAEAYVNQESPTSVLQVIPEYSPGLLTARNL